MTDSLSAGKSTPPHHAHHCHSHHVEGSLDLRLGASAALNLGITLVELWGGICSGSVALLSDAAHNFSDVAAVLLALGARRLTRRPATGRHTYGYKRVEVMAALVNAVMLMVVTALIAREAVSRLFHPEPLAQGPMLAAALTALIANVGSVALLHHHEENDVNVRSAYLHMAQDAMASAAVVVAALLVHTPAGPYVDPVASLLVGFVVVRGAVSLMVRTIVTLLEGVPEGVDLEELAHATGRAFSPIRLHHVHVWEIGHGQRLLTAHVDLGEDMGASRIEALFHRIKAFLHEGWAITHTTLEPEVVGCGDTELLGRWSRGGAHHSLHGGPAVVRQE